MLAAGCLTRMLRFIRSARPDPCAPKQIPIEDVLDAGDDRVPFDRADVLQPGEYLYHPSNASQLFVHPMLATIGRQ